MPHQLFGNDSREVIGLDGPIAEAVGVYPDDDPNQPMPTLGAMTAALADACKRYLDDEETDDAEYSYDDAGAFVPSGQGYAFFVNVHPLTDKCRYCGTDIYATAGGVCDKCNMSGR